MLISNVNVDYSKVDFTRLDSWITVPEFIERFPFSKGQIEGLIKPASRKANGLTKAIKTIGRKLYINHQAFSVWVSQQEECGGDE